MAGPHRADAERSISADDGTRAGGRACLRLGGSLIQDLGYPFWQPAVSNLVHYVRSGDFVEALVRESQDVNELAFALGALAHHASDSFGHSIAVNRVVPIIYPKLRAKCGTKSCMPTRLRAM